ncbi:sorting nexin-10 isoform X1 [Amblyraja radiata]|uniref:sorting nexin-10 isoform X1 n=1 Tax=Amblyraja radiata TaxID=386614 RepID=UPI0014030290|nr:sorting nexin-10 isoform X1 [Amblyraja radiata]XP_032903618.1 sorting nexin-10 isoform X1 [Amblyraja radiata]XP_032903626.1 sorting nexin-10 isoform X1 [Amblyraja radiata]
MENKMKDGKKEFITVWVRDPQIQKEDSWHPFVDYEICVHTNSMCFTKKTSCVRRRYKEFAWLRQRLQDNAVLISLPEIPPKITFLSTSNAKVLEQRRQGLQEFLEKVLQSNILLSDSRLHLFLQSQLSTTEIEACVSGLTDYTVSDAVHRHATSNQRFPVEEA